MCLPRCSLLEGFVPTLDPSFKICLRAMKCMPCNYFLSGGRGSSLEPLVELNYSNFAVAKQWRSSSKSLNPTFMDPNFPQWGWSWLERWVAARPWVPSATTDNDSVSLKSAATTTTTGVEVAKSYARRDSLSPGSQKSTIRPPNRRSPSTGKMKPAISRSLWEDDMRSTPSLGRRRSFGGSSVRDDDSLASSSAVSTLPSYMSPTQSAKAKSRFRSPSRERIGTAETMKKRLSFTVDDKQIGTSPARARRHSGPPKVDVASLNTVG